jgi:NAD(P)-dependent dehydrogenase (short-subunit alcohol dehydrogenase family)
LPVANEFCVLITGAGDSVGWATAEKLLSVGARVHICDVSEDAVRTKLMADPGMGIRGCNAGDSKLFLKPRNGKPFEKEKA